MNKFFGQYADLTALALTFLLPVILTLVIKRKAGKKTRAVPAYLLLFGPCGIVVFIFFHLFENSYRAISAVISGSFVYNFHFYSLLLMGAVIACIGYFFLRACWFKCVGGTNNNRLIFQIMLSIAVVTGPLIPITSISALPLFCCMFSLAGLPFVRRRLKNVATDQLKEESAVMTA
ncbi:MAG TPA: hypothetical protein VJU78_13500 [Chitinophagaceae bacterium]|nr:hypothetical protein [Chitinophagaceae bacterium]